jgi:hypothetical protein
MDTHVELAKAMVEKDIKMARWCITFFYVRNQQGELYLNQLLNLKEAKIDICGKQKLMIIPSSEK